MRGSRRCRPLSRAALLGTGLALGAQAPGGNDDFAALQELLDTPVTTASRFAQKATDAPATVVVVTQDQIRKRNYRSLLDLFQDLPAMKVEYRADPEWHHNFTLRGLPGHDKFVLLLDGVRISAPTNEQVPILENFPLHLAKQVEVVYGPASALYGADALSGVVNIITRKGENAGDAGLHLGDNGLRMEQLYWNTRFKGTDTQITLAGQWFYDNPSMTDLARRYPDYNGFSAQRTNTFPSPSPLPFFTMSGLAGSFSAEPSAPLKTTAIYAALTSGAFGFSIFHNSEKTSSGTGYAPDYAIYDDGTFIGQSQTVVNAHYTTLLDRFTFESSVTASRYDLDPASNFRNFFTNYAVGYKYAESDAFKAEQQVIWGWSDRTTLTAGVSFESYHAIPWSTDLQDPVNTSQSIGGLIRGTAFPADFYAVKYQNIGSYLQAQIKATPRVTLTLGARHDSNSRYGGTLNPRLGAVFNLESRGTFKVLYGAAFLAPSPFAAYAHFGSFNPPDSGHSTWWSPFWRLPNPGLKPIKARTLEASYQIARGSWNVHLVGYYTKLQDLYSLETNGPEAARLYPGNTFKGYPVNAIEVRTNHGKQYNLGGDLRVDYLHSFGPDRRITAFLALSHVDGKVDPLENGTEHPIGAVTPRLWKLGAELAWGPFTFAPRLTVAGEQRMATRDPVTQELPAPLPGYSLLNLAFRYQIASRVEGFLTVANALDRAYKNVNEYPDNPQVTFYGQPQDLRRYSGGVMVKF